MIPSDLILETSRVLLRPLNTNDFDELLSLAQDKDMWYYFTLNLSDPANMKKWIDQLLADAAANTRRPFVIIDKQSGEIAGSMSLMNISYFDLRTEIGASWLGSKFRGSGINKHAKYSMMKHAFDVQQFERVEFKTDVLNERARKGLLNIGGKEEGVLRSHMTMWNNRRRSSIYFSVLKDEWANLTQTIFKDIA